MRSFSDSALPAENRIQHPAASPPNGRLQLVVGGLVAVRLREGSAGAVGDIGHLKRQFFETRQQALGRHPQIPGEYLPVSARYAFWLVVLTDVERHVARPRSRPEKVEELNGHQIVEWRERWNGVVRGIKQRQVLAVSIPVADEIIVETIIMASVSAI